MDINDYYILRDEEGNSLDRNKRHVLSDFHQEHYEDRLAFLEQKYIMLKKLKAPRHEMEHLIQELQALHNELT